MKITEKIEVTETKQVIIGYKCDICEKSHSIKGFPNDYPDNWHYFNHRSEGGMDDSFEESEWFLVCSPECYFEQLKISLEDIGKRTGAEIDDMQPDFVKELLKYIENKS